MLPRDLMKIIWCLAYDAQPDRPWADLLLILDIQNSIPSCLLRDRMPTEQFKTTDEPWSCNTWQLYPPSPYKKGNPYIPMCSMTPNTMPWSMLGGEIFRMLSKQGLHNLRTYKRWLNRKYNKHINRPVVQWNESFDELFSNVELCKPENYNLKDCSWRWDFVHVLLRQLSHARYLTALP